MKISVSRVTECMNALTVARLTAHKKEVRVQLGTVQMQRTSGTSSPASHDFSTYWPSNEYLTDSIAFEDFHVKTCIFSRDTRFHLNDYT